MDDYASALAQILGAIGTTAANRQYTNQQKSLQGMMNESYSNPSSVYNNQYSALDKTFYKDLMAHAAAKGRATDAYKMGVQREAAFQNWLGQYRSGLANQMDANAKTAAINKQNSPYAAGAYVLGSLFGNTVNKQGQTISGPLNKKANDYIQSGIDSVSNMFSTPSNSQQFQSYEPGSDANYINNLSYETNPDDYTYSGTTSPSAQTEYNNLYGNQSSGNQSWLDSISSLFK